MLSGRRREQHRVTSNEPRKFEVQNLNREEAEETEDEIPDGNRRRICLVCIFLHTAFHHVAEARRFWWASRFVIRNMCIQS